MNVVMLVLDVEFGKKSDLLAKSCPLWIVDSKANREALEGSRANWRSLTWFPLRGDESAAQLFARIAPSLDQHHNELAQDPPYSVLDVYGLPTAAGDMLGPLRHLGFVALAVEPGLVRFLKAHG